MNIKLINGSIVKVICLLYVLLFVYAVTSKIMDYETFKAQLGQSPLLSAFASWVSFLVPLIELLITVLLVFPKTRLLGLFSALSLMSMFTTYIFIVLHFSSFVPCSCGGILEKMSWNAHLAFNVFFIVLALFALWLHSQQKKGSEEKKEALVRCGIITFSMLCSIIIVVVLFLSSEEIMHRNNPFIRRYIRHSVELVQQVDLKYNSYYFAGADKKNLYLGNYTDPFGVLIMDSSYKQQQTKRIPFQDNGAPFRWIMLKVNAPFFYLMDGSVPSIFKGTISNWRITNEIKGLPRFTSAEPIDSTRLVLRNNTGFKNANLLGIFDPGSTPQIQYFPWLLQQQIDGIFDTDGSLVYNDKLDKIIYTYYYRNEFIVWDVHGKFYSSHTIDTITRAKIKVTDLKGETERRMSAPPFFVNALTATKNNLLFVHSKVPGRYENSKIWKIASVIDVYDIKKKTYLLSFPLFTQDGSKIKALLVSASHLYALSGSQLYVYELRELLKK